MDTHNNARLTPKGREEMVRAVVDRGMSKAAAARQFNTTSKTVGKWVDRFLAEGVGGLRDRSSRPLSSPVQIPPATCDAVESLRRERRTQEHIAAELGISKASVSRILKRRGLSRLSSLEPQEAIRATSARGLAKSSISTSKNSAVSKVLATASLDAAPAIAAVKARAGNLSTSLSMTILG
jgi:transposase-like protein